jgi:hypothetical protein
MIAQPRTSARLSRQRSGLAHSGLIYLRIDKRHLIDGRPTRRGNSGGARRIFIEIDR